MTYKIVTVRKLPSLGNVFFRLCKSKMQIAKCLKDKMFCCPTEKISQKGPFRDLLSFLSYRGVRTYNYFEISPRKTSSGLSRWDTTTYQLQESRNSWLGNYLIKCWRSRSNDLWCLSTPPQEGGGSVEPPHPHLSMGGAAKGE